MSLFNVFRRRAQAREMDTEMQFHVDMEAAELIRQGAAPDEARRRALAAFGGMQRYKEEGAEARGGTWAEDLMRDVRYAARSLVHARGYSAVVVLTLALGIAATTSIFSVANGVLFKPLPFRDPSRLMLIWDGLDMVGVPEAWVTGPEVVRLRRETKSFEGFSVVRQGSSALGASDGSEPEQVPVSLVSANFFQLLGAGPELGRGFAAGEDAPGAPRVAVISRRLWVQRYGSQPSIIGRSIMVDGQPTTVIGVLPATFRYSPQTSLGSPSTEADVYATFPDSLDRLSTNQHWLGVLARVRDDVAVSDARSDLAALGARLNEETYGKRGFKFVPLMLQERIVREVRPALYSLLAAVGMLMLIMSANLAVLALVRAARREREITVRRAIGASHGRVSRQILTETVLLSVVGAAVGTVLGVWTLRALMAMSPPGMPRRAEIGIDLTVLAVTLGLALVIGIGMGLAPLVHSVRTDIASVLREKAPSHAGGRVRQALVLAQLALSMVLLAGTGLLLSSFVRLMQVDPGFDAEHVLAMDVMASRAKYTSGAPVVDLIGRYVAALRAIPGVGIASATSATPLSAGADQYGGYFPDSPHNTGDRQKDMLLVDGAPVTNGYFASLRIQLLEGEEFPSTFRDTLDAKVVIIDDLLAHRFFHDRSPVGHFMTLDGDSLRIIGVSRHVHMYGMEEVGREQLWLTHRYTPYRGMTLLARVSGDPLAVAAAARQAIRSVDPEQPIVSVVRMSDAVRGSLAQRRLVLTLVGMFAGAALLLAALGIYGVTTSAVTQRTRELGIRMALGADRGSVVWAVLNEPVKLVVLGLVIGLAGTYLSARVVQRLLYGIRPTDPVVLAAVAVVLVLVALVASYLPARRATRVDPMVALRSD